MAKIDTKALQSYYLRRYISEHSDAEYETMLKAFLRLGEDYDKLQSKYDKLLRNCELSNGGKH